MEDTRYAGGTLITNQYAFSWGVLEFGDIEVRVFPAAGRTDDPLNYELFLDLNSANTGLYLNFSGTCASPGNTTIDWFSLDPNRRKPLKLIRCFMGNHSNSGMTLKARLANVQNAQEFSLGTTGAVGHPWHRNTIPVSYIRELDTLSGSRPDYITGTYPYEIDARLTMTEAEIPKAAAKWDFQIPGSDAFVHHALAPNTPLGLTFKAVWHSTTQENPCAIEHLACTQVNSEIYPHLGKQTIWIKYPPAGQYPADGPEDKREITEWTTSAAEAKASENLFTHYYIPKTVMHEMGHAFGLGHSVGGHIMGLHVWGEVIDDATTNDGYGIREMTRSH